MIKVSRDDNDQLQKFKEDIQSANPQDGAAMTTKHDDLQQQEAQRVQLQGELEKAVRSMELTPATQTNALGYWNKVIQKIHEQITALPPSQEDTEREEARRQWQAYQAEEAAKSQSDQNQQDFLERVKWQEQEFNHKKRHRDLHQTFNSPDVPVTKTPEGELYGLPMPPPPKPRKPRVPRVPELNPWEQKIKGLRPNDPRLRGLQPAHDAVD